MKKRLYSFYLLLLSLPHLSLVNKPHFAGILTDGYDILDPSDLIEEGQLSPKSSFPDDPFEHYWLCIEPDEYFMNCENLGVMEPEGWDIGEPTFWIRSGNHIYDFGTRRNWSIEHCNDMVINWTRLMKNEPVVCISAKYIEAEGNKSDWVIDRMKTHHGEWSWFAKKDEDLLSEEDVQRKIEKDNSLDAKKLND